MYMLAAFCDPSASSSPVVQTKSALAEAVGVRFIDLPHSSRINQFPQESEDLLRGVNTLRQYCRTKQIPLAAIAAFEISPSPTRWSMPDFLDFVWQAKAY